MFFPLYYLNIYLFVFEEKYPQVAPVVATKTARGGGGNLFPGPHGATTFQGRNPENLDTILQPGYPNSR